MIAWRGTAHPAAFSSSQLGITVAAALDTPPGGHYYMVTDRLRLMQGGRVRLELLLTSNGFERKPYTFSVRVLFSEDSP